MAALGSVNFNTPGFNPLENDTANWAVITGEGGSADSDDTVPGRCAFHAVGADTAYRFVNASPGTWPDDQYCQAKFWVVSTSGGTGPCVIVRASAVADTYYRLVASHAASNNVVLSKFVAGSVTAITGWPRTQAFTDGDTFRLEIQGTTLRAYYNGVQIGADATDASISAGNPGMGHSTNTTSASIDDWEAGSLSAAAFSLVAGAGSYAVTGTAATVLAGYLIAGTTASYDVTGTVALLSQQAFNTWLRVSR